MAQIMISDGERELAIRVTVMDVRVVDITVHSDLSAEMKIPAGMSWSMAEQYVKLHQKDIFDEYDRVRMRNHQVLPTLLDLSDGRIMYRSGLKLPFLGDRNMTLRVKYVPDIPDTSIYIKRGSDGGRVLTIRTNRDDQEFIRYCIIRYYKKCAAQLIPMKVREFGEKLNLQYNHVRITAQAVSSPLLHPRLNYRNLEVKDQATLWGSCNRRKNLRFDWKLIMLPVEVVDYIIVHELSHLKKMNHSRAFWKEIERVLPEYQECKRWLDRHGKEYEIF